LLPLVAGVWYVVVIGPAASLHGVGIGGILLGARAACSAASWTHDGWLAQHVLVVVWSLAALTVLTAAWSGASLLQVGPLFWSDGRRRRAARFLATAFPVPSSRRWVDALAVLVVALSLRGAWEDPARPYWASGAVLAVAILLGTMALWSRRTGYVVGSALMVNVIAFLAWTAWGPGTLATLITTQVIGLALGSGLWSVLTGVLRQQRPPVDIRSLCQTFTFSTALLALHVLGILVLAGLASDLTRNEVYLGGVLTWVALGVTTAALLLLAWAAGNGTISTVVPPLYAAGLLAIGLSLHDAQLSPEHLAWAGGLLVSAYVLTTSMAAWAATHQPYVRRWFDLEEPPGAANAPWFLTAQAILAGLVLALSVWIALSFDQMLERLAGAAAAGLLTGAAVLLADRRLPGQPAAPAVSLLDELHHLSEWIRQSALVLGLVTVVEAGWALLDPGLPAIWLQCNALAITLLAIISLVYGGVLPLLLTPGSSWTSSMRRLARPVFGLTCLALCGLLVQQFFLYDPQQRHTPLIMLLVILVAGTFAGLIVAFLLFAMVPRRDPWKLSERMRKLHVYSAEAVLVLLLIHVRLNIPDLFPSVLGRYWTLVVMAVAFLGVGLSEWFERRGVRVLAEPLQRTGLFLPLLPLLAYLVRPLAGVWADLGADVPGMQPLLRYLDRLPGPYGWHVAVWLLLALLYTLVAVTRRSSTFGLLAALAANFGLWVTFAHHQHVSFFLHPQLWLIPPALIVVTAEMLNRHRLPPPVSLGLRYLALLMIYISSTADMFITGLGHSVVLPLILAILSILGILAGIVLRVRAFLFLGVAFLFLVIFSQIWHAAVDRAQTWVWWASGIVLGAAVLALFALFEKRRNDVLKMLKDLKDWK
jgi:hypothetical protein